MLHTYGLCALLCMCPTNNNKGQQTTTNDKPWNSDYANELFPILVANCRGSILFIMPITVQRHQAHQPVLVLLFVLAITQTQQAGQDLGDRRQVNPTPSSHTSPSLGIFTFLLWALSLSSLSLFLSLSPSLVFSQVCANALSVSPLSTLSQAQACTHTHAHTH